MFGSTGFMVKKNCEGGLNDMMVEIVTKLEEYSTHYSLNYDELSALDRYFLIKFQDHKKNQFTIFEAYEDDVSESFVVRARNTFESYCKCESRKSGFIG